VAYHNALKTCRVLSESSDVTATAENVNGIIGGIDDGDKYILDVFSYVLLAKVVLLGITGILLGIQVWFLNYFSDSEHDALIPL
jgi:hypothetical protein